MTNKIQAIVGIGKEFRFINEKSELENILEETLGEQGISLGKASIEDYSYFNFARNAKSGKCNLAYMKAYTGKDVHETLYLKSKDIAGIYIEYSNDEIHYNVDNAEDKEYAKDILKDMGKKKLKSYKDMAEFAKYFMTGFPGRK
jgi:hypothetical protein